MGVMHSTAQKEFTNTNCGRMVWSPALRSQRRITLNTGFLSVTPAACTYRLATWHDGCTSRTKAGRTEHGWGESDENWHWDTSWAGSSSLESTIQRGRKSHWFYHFYLLRAIPQEKQNVCVYQNWRNPGEAAQSSEWMKLLFKKPWQVFVLPSYGDRKVKLESMVSSWRWNRSSLECIKLRRHLLKPWWHSRIVIQYILEYKPTWI